jgi:NarL family two-component system response regulator LiaR
VSRVRVALLDDHRVVSRSLAAYFALFPEIEVTGTASSGEELLVRLDEWQPRVVIADLMLPGGIDGVETIRRIRARSHDVGVVALTASTDPIRMMAALRDGAHGYIRKDADPEVLLAAVGAVAAGRTFVDPSAAEALSEASTPVEELSPREVDVLRQMARGRSNKEAASALCVSEGTVKSHLARVLAKLANRADAIVHGLRRGILNLDELDGPRRYGCRSNLVT